MNPTLRICDSCIHFNGENACKAFPEGIPLKSEDTHFETLPGQVGGVLYDMDPEKYDLFDMYRRVHPNIRFPVILSYEIPETGTAVSQKDVSSE